MGTLIDLVAGEGGDPALAAESGEVQATVTSAVKLDDKKIIDISSQISKRLGKNVQVETAVDPSLIGGLVIGMTTMGMDLSEAGATYALLTVGDGLAYLVYRQERASGNVVGDITIWQLTVGRIVEGRVEAGRDLLRNIGYLYPNVGVSAGTCL